MARVKLNAKNYAIKDMRDWLNGELKRLGLRQEDVGKWFGLDQPAVSKKISKMDFTVPQLIEIFDRLGTSSDKIGELLKIRR